MTAGVKGAWEHDAPHNVPPHETVPANMGPYARMHYPPPPPLPGSYPHPYMMHHHHPGPPGGPGICIYSRCVSDTKSPVL